MNYIFVFSIFICFLSIFLYTKISFSRATKIQNLHKDCIKNLSETLTNLSQIIQIQQKTIDTLSKSQINIQSTLNQLSDIVIDEFDSKESNFLPIPENKKPKSKPN